MNHSASLLLGIFLTFLIVGYVSADKVRSKSSGAVDNKGEIYIDDPQMDAIEGSAVDSEFTDTEESSGLGPDDEDALTGSGEGSGAGPWVSSIGRGKTPSTTTTTSTTRKPPMPDLPPVRPDPPTRRPIIDEITSRPQPTISVPPPPPPPPQPPRHEDNDLPIFVPEPATKLPPPRFPYDDNNLGNEVNILEQRADEKPTSFFAQPGILAAVIGGAVVGLLCAILLVMFIVYRMRKKDEGSYALEEPKRSPTGNSYNRNSNKEFYA